ncbi:ubinuclein-1 isoform X2 [Cajanus cajan]|uniref:ubinuclein-1 isoform X2 n=1 Tax=Cajanus cajan TaxID=3821 RepID=UPI00098DB74F|nr:ubinuclein-1 isoform X2 [Cajanus cajan]
MAEQAAPLGGGDSSSAARAPSSFVKKGDRQMFTVELRPGETTIVSWKKLMKDANKVNNGSVSAPEHHPNVNPALESRIAPGQPKEIEEQGAPQTNRFSAVIEKIERLYMGKDSSDDEDLLDVPDDQYDTEDSFIDDAELDEYFEVDNSAIKHDGFFVNRGKLERINEPPVLPIQQAKKRRRKDIPKNPGENIDGHVSNKHVKVGKTTAGKASSLHVKNTISSSNNLGVPSDHCEDMKFRNQLDVSGISLKKKTSDSRQMSDPPVCSKVSTDDAPTAAEEADKQKTGSLQSKNMSDKYKDATGFLDTSHQKYHEKSASAHSKPQPGKTSSSVDNLENTGRSKDKIAIRVLPDLNLSVMAKPAIQAPKSENVLKKDGSSARPKTTTLEKAIRELEKMVAESRPPTMENQEADTTPQAVKRRLPREIKLKLAKVARLAPASQGKVSEELTNRLMSILGHLMQLRTLKRNLKTMISMGLSEKNDRIQQIKKEVVEMIKKQAPSMESKLQQLAGASGEQELVHDGKPTTKRNFSMDTALEDKIYDLYNLFAEGLDEGSRKKLYAELAELFPNGCMDNHGIRDAIHRSRVRHKALYSRHKDREKIKKKKLLAPRQDENVQFDASPITSQQHMRERLATDSSSHTHAPVTKAVSNTVTAARVINPSVNGPKQEKAKGISGGSVDDVRGADGVLIKKKVKRKLEQGSEGTHFRSEKMAASLQGEEKPRSLKQSAGVPLKSNIRPTSLPGLEQSS